MCGYWCGEGAQNEDGLWSCLELDEALGSKGNDWEIAKMWAGAYIDTDGSRHCWSCDEERALRGRCGGAMSERGRPEKRQLNALRAIGLAGRIDDDVAGDGDEWAG